VLRELMAGLGTFQEDNCRNGLPGSFDEQFFGGAQAFVQQASQANGYNQGFLRPGAVFAVMTLNNDGEDDNTPTSVSTFLNYLDGVVGHDQTVGDRLSWSNVNPATVGVGTQNPFQLNLQRIGQMSNLTSGFNVNTAVLTTPAALATLWAQALPNEYTFSLSSVPVPGTLQVSVGGVLQSANDYQYNLNNTVTLSFGPAAGTPIIITYQVSCQ
jgi:hypothetical protein